jgi:hypothetical protein
MRWIITGTTTSAVHSCCAVSDSVASSSNLRLSTTVEARLMPSAQLANPQAWNSGAAIIVRSRACSGITDSSEAIGSTVLGIERSAPFGVPVVPEVRMIARPCCPGGVTSDGSPRSINSSSSGSDTLPSSGSCQAMNRLRRRDASCRTSSNSWS